jgi:L-glutamine-phosphate cytidylyltransferase
MTSIILAAGLGRRLALGTPKCLVEIAGVSILKRQISAFRGAGVKHFAIVVGYGEEDVRRHLADDEGPFTFVVNDRFAETNTIYSLFLARGQFGSGFFFANGDVVFDHRLACRLLTAASPSAMAVKPGRCGQEEVKVMVDPCWRQGIGGGRIIRIGKQLDPARSFGEFIGVARFGSDLVASLADMLSRCVLSEGIVGDHFETAVDRLCFQGHVIAPIDVHDLPCGEIDFPADLQHARQELGPRLQF